MAYRNKTLRSMSPTTRKLARLIGELESTSRRIKNLIPEIERMELDSRALFDARGKMLMVGNKKPLFEEVKKSEDQCLQRIKYQENEFVTQSCQDIPGVLPGNGHGDAHDHPG